MVHRNYGALGYRFVNSVCLPVVAVECSWELFVSSDFIFYGPYIFITVTCHCSLSELSFLPHFTSSSLTNNSNPFVSLKCSLHNYLVSWRPSVGCSCYATDMSDVIAFVIVFGH